MVIHLYSGETRLRTIYNVTKVTQDDHCMLRVTNKVEGQVILNTWKFKKNFNRFEITND